MLTLALLIGGARTATATEVGSRRPLGLGFAVGTPTSIVGKYFIGGDNALDFGIGFWSYRDCYDRDRVHYCDGGAGHLGLNADYLWQEPLARGTANLDWHIGVGARLWVFDDYYSNRVGLAARMPVGLDLTFARPTFLEVFLELAPALNIVPTRFDIEAFLGVRFYF
jgi:hypothetical protein